MIVLFLEGGLGNQLFQYAAARTLSKLRENDDIIIDTDFYKGFGDRRYELNKFKFSGIRIASEKDKQKMKYRIAQKKIDAYKQRITLSSGDDNRNLNNFYKSILAKQGIYICGGTVIGDTRLPLNLIKRKDIFLYGYFQHPRFRQNIQVKLKNVSVDMKLWEKDIIYGEHICVHIRLGDYVNNDDYEVCTKEYYYSAIEYIAGIVKNPVFHIFSDDIEAIKREFRFAYPVVYENEKIASKCLVKMSLCKHFVISNSTFSWWAQRLSKNKNKIVVAPGKWYGDESIPFYLYDKAWIIMKP